MCIGIVGIMSDPIIHTIQWCTAFISSCKFTSSFSFCQPFILFRKGMIWYFRLWQFNLLLLRSISSLLSTVYVLVLWLFFVFYTSFLENHGKSRLCVTITDISTDSLQASHRRNLRSHKRNQFRKKAVLQGLQLVELLPQRREKLHLKSYHSQ